MILAELSLAQADALHLILITVSKYFVLSTAVQWDSAVTLAYAAEQLFAAAQLLTSDMIPWNRAVRAAYLRHLGPLLDNGDFLPADIREDLKAAQKSYFLASAHGLSPEFSRQLANELMKILRRITPMLNRVSPSLRPEPLDYAA